MQSFELLEMWIRRLKFLDTIENHFASLAPIEKIPVPQGVRSSEWFKDCGLDKILEPYAVMGFKFPGYSGKVVGMSGILFDLYHKGILNPDVTIGAPTSGNLGGAGALLVGPRSRVRIFEAKEFVAFVESTTSEGKKAHLKMSGATVVVAPQGMTAIAYAKEWAQKKNRYFLDQYTDINNVLAQRYIAQAVYRALGSKVSSFVCAIGSMASFVGAHRFLPSLAGSHVKILGVASMLDKKEKVPGSRSRLEIVESGFGYKEVAGYEDYPLIENVSKYEAAVATDEYVRSSISVGWTGGLASAGYYKLLEAKAKSNSLGDLMNPEGQIVPVFLFMDMYLPYAIELTEMVYPS
jgi:cysteine synthase